MARILVAGGSLGGLLTANMLHRAGHDVVLLEKATGSLDGRGAGIVTHRPLVTALARCGITSDAPLGVAINRRVILDREGNTADQAHIPQVLTSWSRLYAILLAVFPAERYLQGAAVSQVRQTDDGVSVQCEDGRRFEAELLVASDGIRSAVRSALAPEVKIQYAGYVAWRGVCDESVLSRRTLETVFETFGFGLPPDEQIIGYPVAGAGNSVARGQRRYNFVWYRPAADNGALQALMTDADGQYHPLGLPPHKVDWRNVAAVRQAAREKLAPQFAEILEKTAQPFLQPIYDLSSERIAFDRIALMGDAAFVARPHVGMGVTKAAEDAMAMADSIAAHGATPQALQAFEQLRRPAGQAAVQRARRLGAYMQSHTQPGATADSIERDAREVMMETAIDLSPVPA
ncbi:MAG: FAD-dependent monooxygenase [Hylemonella sp.]|nr:FAD-dependent monooxygenase [Hylemonella sp.]